jgi:Pyruvate/2-oxoacid:ferredoxin oxidoreductase delta subunit
MKRKIIRIDEEKCNGCGQCIPNCPEGALQVIDNKARLVSDLFCDGLGACIGNCPLGAISVEEREAEAYDEGKVMENIVRQGPNVIAAHLAHLQEHGEKALLHQAIAFLKENNMEIPHFHKGGCPGAAARDMRKSGTATNRTSVKQESQLQNWPVQLMLLNPQAAYLKSANLLVCADCVPFAFADFHHRFLQGKIMLTFCPKLDRTIDQYIDKLALIFETQDIESLSVVHMEVPCCSGTLRIVEEALKKAGKIMPLKEYTISIQGEII